MPAIRILLVEDEGLIRMMVVDFLEDEGFDVIEAHDGEEAAKLLDEAARFDVLFTDVRMPGMLDGIDVALRAQQRHPGLPVLVVSGYSAELTTRLGLLEPAVAFLGKPYRLREVADTLKRLAIKA